MRAVADGTVTVTYATQIATARLPTGTAASAVDWTGGLPLDLSVTVGGPVPVTTVKLGGLDITTAVNLVAADGSQLVINFNLGGAARIYCRDKPGMYVAGTATLDASGAAFTGSVASTCQDRSGTGAYPWRGKSSDADASAVGKALRTLIEHLQQSGARR
jgi:hypothetical protein